MDNLLPNSQRKQNILPGPLRQSCYGLVVNKIKLYLWRWAAHAMHGLLLQDKGIFPAASLPAPRARDNSEWHKAPLYQYNCSCPLGCTGRTILAKTKSHTLLISMTLCGDHG